MPRSPGGDPFSVLVLEDEADFAGIVLRRLRSLVPTGARLDHAATLAEALARLGRYPADLVIADLGLPDAQGLQALERLLANGARLVLVLSGIADPALHEEALARGAYDVLRKDQLDGVGLERLVRLAAVQARTLRALRASEERSSAAAEQLRLIADSVPAMIAYYDREVRLRYANRQHVEFYGYSLERTLGRHMRDAIGEDAWIEVRPHFERAYAGEALRYQRTVRRPGREPAEIEVHFVPHRDESGGVCGLYVMVTDITERRRGEETLRLRERALEASVNPMMISAPASAEQRLVYVNPAFERVTGFRREEALGRDPRLLLGADRDQPGVAALEGALAEGREITVLLRNHRKDGTAFWNELHVAPVPDAAGQVSHFVWIATDVSERIRHLEVIEHQANYDGLTGLPNRNLLNDRLAQALVHARRSGRSLAVMFVDLDHLKRVNDTLGHAIGDQLIATAGRRIAGALRGGDTVARLSGDEFIALLSDLHDESDAAQVAAKVRAAVGAPLRVQGHEFVLTTSIGIALCPRDGTEGQTLLRNADIALYRAKEDGRDCFRFFAPEMNAKLVHFLDTERALREALEAGDFRLHFQPIVRLADGVAVGAEALLRLRRRDGSLAPPAELIPVAEESGLIVPIGRWVLEAAVRQAGAWNRGRRRPFVVSVNISARQFRDAGLLDAIRAVFRATRVAPTLVRLEITESTVMQEPKEAARILRALKGLGVRISIDDFGTGYSSLAYLKQLPIDSLKIDRSFVRGLPADRADVALSRTVMDLARGLGFEAIAEGVETRSQASALARLGCRLAQGYLFGRPVDAAEFGLRPRRVRPR